VTVAVILVSVLRLCASASVRSRVRKTFGVHMIVTGMMAHRFSAHVQHHCAWALGNLALDGW
jgi:hypothetical protein